MKLIYLSIFIASNIKKVYKIVILDKNINKILW